MTTVQVPRSLVAALPRFQVHRRQPFHEILVAAVAALREPVRDPLRPAGREGKPP